MLQRPSSEINVPGLSSEGSLAGPGRGYPSAPEATPFDIRELLGTFRRYLWLIVLASALGTTAAVWWVKLELPQYDASAVVRLIDARRALGGNLVESQVQGLPGDNNIDRVLSQVEILSSRSVAAQVVDSIHELRIQTVGFPASLLNQLETKEADRADSLQLTFTSSGYRVRGYLERAYGIPVEVGGLRFSVTQRPKASTGSLILTSREEAIQRLVGRLRVKPRPNTEVIDVSYFDHDPVLAQRVVNRVVEEFQEVNAQTAQQQSIRRSKFLEMQLRHQDSVLAEARTALTAFRGRQHAYSTKARLSTEQASLSGLEVRREELDADRTVVRNLLEELENNRGAESGQLGALMSAPGIAVNPVISGLYAQLNRYQIARDSLTTGSFASTDENPDVQRANTLIKSTQEKLLAAARSVLASLDARIASLDGLRARNSSSFPALTASEEDEARLEEQVESARGMVAQLREEHEKARLAVAVEVGQVEIVDLAMLPDAPIGVSNTRKLLLGFLAGLILGCGGALLLEHLNTSIRRRAQIRTVLQLPELAVIPQVKRVAHRSRIRANPTGRNGTPGAQPRGGALRVKGDMLVAPDVRSVGAEAYRLLRTNLLFSNPNGLPRTMVVTSPAPGDGKTTVAANLAATFARQGMKVLLIDCDLRRGRIHGLFRISREPGLTQVLAGHLNLRQAVHETTVEGLSLLSTGAVPTNPGELVGGDSMRGLLEAASQEFALVVLDTPPVLSAADATVLSSMVDATLLVIRAGRTRELEAQATLEQLHAVNARVVGAVLNDQDSKLQQYGDYPYYAAYSSGA